MRTPKLLISLFASLLLFAAVSASATSITVKTRSEYGPSGITTDATLKPPPPDGIIETLGCDSSLFPVSCTAGDTVLEVSIPNLAPGTTFDFQGLANVPAFVLCDNTPFLAGPGCGTNPPTVSTAAQACINSLNPQNVGGDFEITTPTCSITSSNAITLVFEFSGAASFATDVTVVGTSTSAPEPGTLALAASGVLGLFGLKRRGKK